MTRVAINGFGRIGRNVLRAALDVPGIEIIAVNDLTDAHMLAHLLKYDSVHGIFDASVEAIDGGIKVNDEFIKVISERDPSNLPWKELGVELVIESTGRFTDREGSLKHINAGAKKVLISAPGKDEDITIVMGVNEVEYDSNKHNIISNASCTTNCLASFAKILYEKFGIRRGFMTTIHSYTNDQQILDLPHRDYRRARAAAVSIIPTTTGAAKAVSLVLPGLKGKLNGSAMRVPTPNVSVVDLVVELDKNVTIEEVNSAFKWASENELKGILDYSDLPLVSVDYNNNPNSAIIDGLSTMVIDGNLLKVVAWYDNEWGYSNRVVDLAAYMIKKGL